MDETGGIRATAFNAVAEDLFEKLQEGKVYFISRARINVAKKKFSNHPNNEYEMNFEKNTEVEECFDATNVPSVQYNFVELSKLEDLVKDSICDVLGVVKEAGPLGEITTKATSRTVAKRDLTLVDRSGFSVRLTLWGKQAEQWNEPDQPIIACKGVRVGDFGGRSLSVLSSSTTAVNPDIDAAHALRGWFDAMGSSSNFQSHTSNSAGGMGGAINPSELRTLQAVKDEGLGQSDKVDYFAARATVVHIKTENVAYPACPTEGCNKKVTDSNDGTWRCEKCDRTYDKPEYRYIVGLAVADHTGQAWFQGFNDAGVMIFGKPANDVMEMKNNDDNAYQNVMKRSLCKSYTFSCRAKQDTFNDQTRVRYAITKIQPMNFETETKALLATIESYPVPMQH